MATSKTTVKDNGQDEVDEMFGQQNDDGDFIDAEDLLDQVEEDDSEGWVPTEKGEGIAGIVTKIGETRSDFASGDEDPMCPTVTVQTKSGDKWRVIGYGAVLKRELKDANPQVGDMIAVKYFGEKPIKNGKFKGRPYKHFGVVVRKAAANV